MRIKLLTNLGNDKISYLNTAIILKTPHQRTKSICIVDTGSPITIISYSDARRLQIPYFGKEEIINIGGRKYQGYSFKKLTMVFISENGESVEENFEEVKVVKPTSHRDIEEIDRMPTIIGTDFLKKKRYKLFCDIANDVAYLEK